uniref:FAD-binding PCMH-type domain-containing protein n=1 Tax=Pinguiococcus pyrenoidosus TaxID=172671 RepID=A0A7R9U4K0_9STRA
MDGNLCRCTGYRPILDAAKTFASDNEGCCGGGRCGAGGGCAALDQPNGENSHDPGVADGFATIPPNEEVHVSTEQRGAEAIFRKNYRELGVCEPIFPPSLMLSAATPLARDHGDVKWFKPVRLEQLLVLKDEFPDAVIVRGNTEVGVDLKFKGRRPGVYIHVGDVPELSELGACEDHLTVGGCASLRDVEHFFAAYAEDGKDSSKAAHAMQQMLRWFASNQIRNVASLAGNLATASPISDMNPMLMAADATLVLHSLSSGVRELPVREFFMSYRKTALRPDEVIVHIRVPLSERYEIFMPFKQARRREDDISIVTGGIRICYAPEEGEWKVTRARLCFGGMAAVTKAAIKTEDFLVGKTWSPELVREATQVLTEELRLPDSVPGGQAEYRVALPPSFLFKLFLRSCDLLNQWTADDSLPTGMLELEPVLKSGQRSFVDEPKGVSRGEHHYKIEAGGLQSSRPEPHAPQSAGANPERAPVGQPLMHKSALQQVTGEARYVDDIPAPSDALHAGLVLSERAHARILSVDPTAALEMEGVEAFFGADDVPGNNAIGPVVKDEECFASEFVHCVGQVIGVVIATSANLARIAASKVDVEYEDLEAILDIQDAIAAESYMADIHQIQHGDADAEEAALLEANSGAVVDGECFVGGQEHFYLETNATLVVPQEDGGLEIFSSTQNCTKTQNFAAHVCGVDANKVVARMKRMGGAFGGKETRSVFVSCAIAVAASHLQVPIRIMLDRDVDMQCTGQRHAFYAKYRAGADSEGNLRFLKVDVYNNAGCSLDLSAAVMDRALFHLDNAYQWRALCASGYVCRTNMPSHTAFRGFGGPQGMMICESAMDHLAAALQMDVMEMRKRNLYGDGAVTHYGQRIPGPTWHVPRMLDELLGRCDFASRKALVDHFNRHNRYRKRGIAWVPTKFGINFTAKFMNQGGALVHVYTDGTVLVSHGGTEMGQGLHTKMAAIAAQCFGIPAAMVHVAETASDKVPNASPTAASMSTDLYGMAVLDACEQILSNLRPIIEKNPGGDTSWPSIVQKAYFERVNLSAQGFYAVPGDRCGYDWNAPVGNDNSRRGMPFNYFTQGVACSEVEVDCLTGDFSVLRSDILMDLGKSINPVIDIGQIEGGFVQGLGWLTTEEAIWGDKNHQWVRPGQLFSRGPGFYKIPAANDVPKDLRVHLLNDAPNPFAVHSSKAVGEPPYFTAASAYFAIRDAVRSARRDQGFGEKHFYLHAPATSEKIRMACLDPILEGVGWKPDDVPKGSY